MEKATAKPASPSTEKPRRKRREKLTPFDSDALKLVRRGEGSIAAIASSTGVEPGLARQRMLALEKKGMLVFDPANPDRLSLTIRGYNEFQPPSLDTTMERKAKKKEAGTRPPLPAPDLPAIEKTAGVIGHAASPNTPNAEETPGVVPAGASQAEHAVQEPSVQKTTAPRAQDAREPKLGHLDLAELMARGAPTGRNRSPEKKTQATASDGGKESESCDLCKDPFTLAVTGGNPKFGHCFCGAAYHRDCFEAVIEGDGRCVRCGRKLERKMDRKSAEAMRAIRDPFE